LLTRISRGGPTRPRQPSGLFGCALTCRIATAAMLQGCLPQERVSPPRAAGAPLSGASQGARGNRRGFGGGGERGRAWARKSQSLRRASSAENSTSSISERAYATISAVMASTSSRVLRSCYHPPNHHHVTNPSKNRLVETPHRTPYILSKNLDQELDQTLCFMWMSLVAMKV
jgi:hypothetical protein